MEKEVIDSIQRLKKIENELGIEENENELVEVPEDTFDYTERLLFSSIQEIKDVRLICMKKE